MILKGNILVDADGAARLTDFGLSVLSPGSSSHPAGAIRWAAPELLAPDEFVLSTGRPTFESDAYSFGCVCYEVSFFEGLSILSPGHGRASSFILENYHSRTFDTTFRY